MIRRYLVTGFITLLPLMVTLWLLQVIFSGLVDVFRLPFSWVSRHLGLPMPSYWELAIFSALAVVALLLLVGVFMSNVVGRQVLALLDDLMGHIPVVKSVYGATKQLMNAIQSGRDGSFKEVVMVEWPHPGSFTLGFVASRNCGWAVEGGEELISVYIPTAPNPTSGYVIMLPGSRVKPLNVRPEQALTWAVSGGVVVPGSNGESR